MLAEPLVVLVVLLVLVVVVVVEPDVDVAGHLDCSLVTRFFILV